VGTIVSTWLGAYIVFVTKSLQHTASVPAKQAKASKYSDLEMQELLGILPEIANQQAKITRQSKQVVL